MDLTFHCGGISHNKCDALCKCLFIYHLCMESSLQQSMRVKNTYQDKGLCTFQFVTFGHMANCIFFPVLLKRESDEGTTVYSCFHVIRGSYKCSTSLNVSIKSKSQKKKNMLFSTVHIVIINRYLFSL